MAYVNFELEKGRVQLIKLINNEGEIIDKKGWAEEIRGIYDEEGEEYIAGYDENGELYACNVDTDNTVLNFDWERTQYKL